jgi:hypothetical protein
VPLDDEDVKKPARGRLDTAVRLAYLTEATM